MLAVGCRFLRGGFICVAGSICNASTVVGDRFALVAQVLPFLHSAFSLCHRTSIVIVACGMPRGLTSVWEHFLGQMQEIFEVHEVRLRNLTFQSSPHSTVTSEMALLVLSLGE